MLLRGCTFMAAVAVVLSLSVPQTARAEPTREFIMSATYGVLAGTLVGAATLAFTDKPGDNLRNIARGASYGLYAGILLGLYVVYGVPDGDEPPESAPVDPYNGPLPEESENIESPSGSIQKPLKPKFERPAVVPLISDRGVDGAGLVVRYVF
jgi:hypothetical protein